MSKKQSQPKSELPIVTSYTVTKASELGYQIIKLSSQGEKIVNVETVGPEDILLIILSKLETQLRRDLQEKGHA